MQAGELKAKQEIFDLWTAQLSKLFGSGPSADVLAIYWDELKDYPSDSIRYGMREARRTCQTFPTIATLVTLIESRPRFVPVTE